jgi:hypothetical protein
MDSISKRGSKLVLAWSLGVAVTAATLTACGGSASSVAQGAGPGQWTKTEVSQFTTAGGTSASGSQDSCIIGYFERDMSFGNAMDIAAVDPPSSSMSAAQIESAVTSKYGASAGAAINAQFEQVITDAAANCADSGS